MSHALMEGMDTVYSEIQKRLAEPNGVVLIATAYKATYYYPKHAALFVEPKRPEDKGVFVKRGKRMDYVLPGNVRLGRMVPTTGAK